MSAVFEAQFLVPTAISFFALVVSYHSYKNAKTASDKADDATRRFEVYQFFPMLTLRSEPDNEEIKLVVRNDSSENASSKLTVDFVLRISSESTFSVDKEGFLELDPVEPNTRREEFPAEINHYVGKALNFLRDSDPDKTNFVLRLVAKYSSPHPDAEHIAKTDAAFYRYRNGQLELDRRGE